MKFYFVPLLVRLLILEINHTLVKSDFHAIVVNFMKILMRDTWGAASSYHSIALNVITRKSSIWWSFFSLDVAWLYFKKIEQLYSTLTHLPFLLKKSRYLNICDSPYFKDLICVVLFVCAVNCVIIHLDLCECMVKSFWY